MELRRMPRRLVRAAVLVATGGAVLVAVPMASAKSLPLRSGVSHIGLRGVTAGSGAGVSAATVTSTNWSGYAQTGSTYSSVTTSWTQTAANCSQTPNSYAAFWDGLDGYSSSTVEQDGTLAECVSSGRRGRHGGGGQTAEYYAWYEAYPAPMYQYGGSVVPGDVLTATVSYISGSSFTLMLSDSSNGTVKWNASKSVTVSGAARSSAEVIAEAPSSSSGVLPLADFGTVNFSKSTVNGTTMSSGTEIEMVSNSGQPEAVPGPLSGGAFSDTWQ